MYDIRKINIWKTEENRHENTAWKIAGLEELNLSTRSYNSLKRAGCSTVGDILQLLGEEGNGLKGIRNLGAKSEREILRQIEWYRKEHAHEENSAAGNDTGEERSRPFIRRAEVRGRKNIWDADIEDFHLSDYAMKKLKDCKVQKVKDLYATNPKSEPGWYAVRELLEKI